MNPPPPQNQNWTVLIAEGKQDLAFIARLLQNSPHFDPYEPKIGELSNPLREYLKNKILENDYDSLEVNRFLPPIPHSLFHTENKDLLILYEMGGKDSNEAISSENLKKFTSLQTNEIKELSECSLGCYIFHGPNVEKGCLEDTLLPLMKEGNNKEFNDLERYFDEYDKDPERKFKNLKRNKAVLTAVGQLHNSGSALNIVIKKTPYLTPEKLKNPTCNTIVEFIQKAAKHPPGGR